METILRSPASMAMIADLLRTWEDRGPLYDRGGGTADDTAAILAGLAAFGAKGGSLRIGAAARHLIGNLTMPDQTSLDGDLQMPEQQDVGESYYQLGSQLIQQAGTTVAPGRGGGLRNLSLIRAGLSLPVANDAGAAAVKAQFAGDAITANKVGSIFENLLLLGHNRGITITHAGDGGRTRIRNVNIDANNGIDCSGAYDICYIEDVHCWPFLTVHVPGIANSRLERPGTGLYFGARNDWSNATRFFSYGYAYGCAMVGAKNVAILRCQFDYPNPSTNSVAGLFVAGDSDYITAAFCTMIGPKCGALVGSSSTAVSVLSLIQPRMSNAEYNVDIHDGSVDTLGGSYESAGIAAFNVRAGAGDLIAIAPRIKTATIGFKFDAAWTGRAIIVAPSFEGVVTKWDIPAAVRDRVTIIGARPEDAPAWGTRSLTQASGIAAGTGTITSATATLRYERQDRRVTFSVIGTMTNNGTGGAFLTLALPFAAEATGYHAVWGHNANTAHALHGRIDPGASVLSLMRYDGTYPVATGNTFVASGHYECA
jgi:hypothetical protein